MPIYTISLYTWAKSFAVKTVFHPTPTDANMSTQDFIFIKYSFTKRFPIFWVCF